MSQGDAIAQGLTFNARNLSDVPLKFSQQVTLALRKLELL
jgi:hypothetical protein